MLPNANRFGDLRRSTLSWCRRTRISASNAARDLNRPIKAHQINLQRSPIGSEYQPIRGRSQRFWVCGRDRLAQQLVGAFPWSTAPRYLGGDNDRVYGQAFTNRVRAMGIRDRPISPRSPWQNPYAERLIGTLRRDCLDHVLIFGERHLRGVLTLYSLYYNEARTHLGLGKDAP